MPLSTRLSGFYFSYFAFIGVFATYFGLYLKDLGFSGTQIGLLMSLLHIVRVVTPNFWGWLADHLHMRMPIVRVTFAASMLAFALLYFVDQFAVIFIVFVLMTAFWSCAMPLFEASVVSRFAEGGAVDMGRYGRIRLWGSIGYIVAVAFAGWLLDRIEIRWLLTMVMAWMVVLLVFSWLTPEHVSGESHEKPEPVWKRLKEPAIACFIAACFMNAASQGASFVFFSIYMVEHGHSKTAVGALWSIGVVFEIAMFMLLPRLFQRYTHYSVFVFGFGASIVRYLIVAAFPDSFLAQAVAQALHMFTFATYHAIALNVVHSIFTGRAQNRGQAMYTSLSWGLGGAVGGLLAGWTWDAWGHQPTFAVSAVLSACGLMLVLLQPGAVKALGATKA